MASNGAMQEAYSNYDNSSYMGVYPQQWQEWNWGADASEYTTGEQFCGNVAFFVPFPGMVGGMPMTNTTTNNNQENGEATQPTKADLQEMEAKMAKLQAENQRLMQLCENERQMRQIEVSAKQQILEMYAVPRSEVEQLVRRFQEDSPTAMQQMHYGETPTPFVSASNASTAAGSPGTGSSASLETLLQDLYKKLYEPDERSNDQEEQGGTSRDPWEANEASIPAPEEEELQQHLSHLESLAGMEIDDRAKGSLLRMSPAQGKLALRKVEDIIQEQQGFCHNLSSMVQSVCRKMSHVSRQWA